MIERLASSTKLIWEDLITHLRAKIPEAIINDRILKLKLVSYKNNVIIFSAVNQEHKDYIEENYVNIIKFTLEELLDKEIEVNITIPKLKVAAVENIDEKIYETQLYDKYTFDNFVVGQSNRFAYTACRTVAQDPYNLKKGLTYNPLFIYGKSGLGKTHLLHAIGNHIRAHYKGKNILYSTAETFLNDFIIAIKNKQATPFQQKYRLCDVLLMDDVHFLSGKEGAQEEFFHTFNTLHQYGKNIILTSDRPPSDIPKIEQRIISRFNWGLIVDINPPDFETRIAILQNKISMENMNIPKEVVHFIAEKITTNIRDLEGALLKIAAYSSLLNKKIDIFSAKSILKELSFNSNNNVSISKIQRQVADYFNLDPGTLLSKSRKKFYTLPRHIAMYLTRELTSMSLPEIGNFYKRDHTSVIHACDKIKNLINFDADTKNTINELRYRINR